jgi:nitroreductase
MIQSLKKAYTLALNIWDKIDISLVKIFYHSILFSNMYYMLFSTSFYREHRAVLAGRAKYLKDLKSKESNYFRLVRNTHRIEKGLLMRPRRPIFARDYIEETMDSFEGIWRNNNVEKIDNPQFKWFYDVLKEYFDNIGYDYRINIQKDRFLKLIENSEILNKEDYVSIPYHRSIDSQITYSEFFKLLKQRRSVRWFLKKKVPRETIDNAVLAACQAPSACNRQPFFYKIIDDPILIKEFVGIPMGTAGYSNSIQTFVIVVGNLDAYYSERDRHLIYIDASLANMNFMLALETLGLSSCPINWPDIEKKEKQMDKILNLKPYQRPIMCIAIGYPDPEGMVAFSEKRNLDNIRSYNI